MANANNSIITSKLKGSIGKQLVFREWAGKTIVAKSPKGRSGEPTDAQVEAQERFQFASRYAKAVTDDSDQSLAQAYQRALRPRQNVYSRALEDFLSLPKIRRIDARAYRSAAGDKIQVRAIDDFRVVSVRVEIYRADGSLIEDGDAEQNVNGIDWTYTAKTANGQLTGTRIVAIATDVPGNEGASEFIIQ